jgi:pimeloyl-ACP methyl ester carboxylesterase
MTTFALIHGGAHGGWCWELVAPELSDMGHTCVTPDLPIEDDDAGLEEWASAVIDSIPTQSDDDVVIVGHSMGGLVVPVVAAKRPVRRMVFLGGIVPAVGITPLEQHVRQKDMVLVRGVEDAYERGEMPAGDGLMSWEDARYYFYHDVEEETARRAWQRLRRQSLEVMRKPFPLSRWPDVPTTYIVMTDDHSVNPSWSRRYARDVLGADLIEIAGSHSPFYSRPQELAAVLAGL